MLLNLPHENAITQNDSESESTCALNS